MASFSDPVIKLFTTTVALITTHWKGRSNVMAAEWAFNISYTPFLIGVFVNPAHYTFDLLDKSMEFGANFCSQEQAGLAHAVGSVTGRELNKFKEYKHLFEFYEAKHIKAPLIKGCIINAECKVKQRHSIGDHELFVGEVLRYDYDESKKPLIYHLHKYFELGKQIQKPSK